MSKTALIIGDSHVDDTDAYLSNSKTACFGSILAGKLAALGYSATLAGVGGSTAAGWLKDKVSRPGKSITPGKLPKSPDLLIIALGSNDMAKGANPLQVVADVQELAARFSARSVLWVGPPWMRSNSSYNNANMAKLYSAAGGVIFDSRDATRAPVEAGNGDGIHSGKAAASAWAASVISAVDGSGSIVTAIAGAVLAGLAFSLWRRRK